LEDVSRKQNFSEGQMVILKFWWCAKK